MDLRKTDSFDIKSLFKSIICKVSHSLTILHVGCKGGRMYGVGWLGTDEGIVNRVRTTILSATNVPSQCQHGEVCSTNY